MTNNRSNLKRVASQEDFPITENSGISRSPGNGNIPQVSFAPETDELRPLLEALLATFMDAVEATASVIRFASPHSQPSQPAIYAGVPIPLLPDEDSSCLPCGTCAGKTGGHGIYFVNIDSCLNRTNCRYTGGRFKSIIVAPLECDDTSASDLPGKSNSGTVSLFFDHPQPPGIRTRSIESFAQLIETAIRNDKSRRETKRAALLAERHDIANEIHDSLAQTLAYTRMRSSLLIESLRSANLPASAKYARDIDEALEISQKTVRELITDFRCSIDPAGLLHALQDLAGQFSLRNGVELEYANRIAQLDLPLEHEIQVFHIVQEALSNIANHSGATSARLTADRSGGSYIFTIEDNGSGGGAFVPLEGHYGLMIMRERAQRIGGTIKIAGSKDQGTHVQLFFPDPATNWKGANE